MKTTDILRPHAARGTKSAASLQVIAKPASPRIDAIHWDRGEEFPSSDIAALIASTGLTMVFDARVRRRSYDI